MTTSDNRPNPFLKVWAESDNSIKEVVSETATEAEGKHKARASMELGFPPITMKSAMTGGVPPWGQDHNGILNRITEAVRWIQAGGCASFNRALCNKIDGYPKGAMLQTKGNALYLWFSTIDQNTNNPDDPDDPDDPDNSDTKTSPDNGWVKLDFKDLEKRLKAAEDHIVVIDGRLDGHDVSIQNLYDTKADTTYVNTELGKKADTTYVNTELGKKADTTYVNTELGKKADTTYVNTELGKKADTTYVKTNFATKNGSCDVPFSADVMKASKYKFCNSLDDESVTRDESGHVQFSSHYGYKFNLIGSENSPCIDNHGSLIKQENGDEVFVSYCTLNASSVNVKGGWFSTQCETSVDGYSFQLRTKDKKRAWISSVDEDTKNLRMEYVRTSADGKEVTRTAFLEMTHENDTYNIYALQGAFVSHGSADLAEYYQADRGDYEPGTLMCHGVDTEVTLCQSIDQSDNFFGVISTSPAYIMNGKVKDEPNSVLIALNGKVPVKVKGVVKRGDKITIGQDGYGVVSKNKNDVIVGRAKEDKVTEEVGLVSCYVQAHM